MNEAMNYVGDKKEMAAAEYGVTTKMMMERQAQEVQAAIVIAKKFPRNYVIAANRVVDACKRKRLAETAIYEYPRSRERVTGPSIRLAEELARDWGNMQYGIIELEQREGESVVEAYAWDLETNVRQSKIFTVKHIRYTKKGSYRLTDPRDIYELVANNGARRVRACILGIIPGDVVEDALDQCRKTLVDSTGNVPVVDLVRNVAQVYKDKLGVTLVQLEKYIGWKSESFTVNDVLKLRRLYTSISDGLVKKEEVFDMNASADDGQPVDAFAVKKEQPKIESGKSGKSQNAAGKKQEKPKEQPKEQTKSQEVPQPAPGDEYAQFEQQYFNGNPDELPFR